MTRSRYGIIVLMLLAGACTPLFFDEDPPNTPAAVFEEFWKGIDENWPEFATKNVNWDSIYQVYRPQVDQATTNHLGIYQQLINYLKDPHTDLFPGNYPPVSYNPTYPENFHGYQWLRSNYLQDAVYNATIAYAKLTPEVGYVYIHNFFASIDDYRIIDNIIRDFKGAKGIIVDVRANGGGSSTNANMIASRFITQTTTTSYSRYRINSSRMAMSDFVPITIDPDGPDKFLGKVVVLTNRKTFSSAEDFVLSMRASGHVIVMGDNTRGGSGSHPILRELPNGWAYRMSSLLRCDLSKQPITGGIVPDILVSTTETDRDAGKDTIIEAAIAEITK